MNKQLLRNRLIIMVVFAMAVVPFIIAWALFQNPDLLETGTNRGKLIHPAVPTKLEDWRGIDKFSIENIHELSGHWVMINLIPGKDCKQQCQEAIHKTKQMRLMSNKDLTRIRRIVVFLTDVNLKNNEGLWQKDTRLLRVRPSQQLSKKLLKIRNGNIPEGMLMIMDPLGNLMMEYEPGFNPYDVLKDLKKLLKISQIG